MARTADRPGTYRLKQGPDSDWILSGVRRNGKRVRVSVGSEAEGRIVAGSIWGSQHTSTADDATDPATPTERPKIESGGWSFPAAFTTTTEAVKDLNDSIGLGAAPKPAATTPQPTKEDLAKKALRAREAASLAEFLGAGYAASVVYAGKGVTRAAKKDPVNPSKEQVKALASSTTLTIQEIIGDKDIKPWHMMILQTFGLIGAMLLQSPKLEVKPKKDDSRLASVP